MKTRIDEILSQHVIDDIKRKCLSPWRMLLHFWLMLTRREKLAPALSGIFREFQIA
ncbi:MAG: hypothetical protein P1U89_23990 [Verrucomicrobiales bacterium]|nr:hypothetical protein [Verrucomicrobiales bacterium]